MKSVLLSSVIFAILGSPVFAGDWQKRDVDMAIAVVAAREQAHGVEACVTSSGTRIVHEVEHKDINADGIDELIVTSRPDVLGSGVTGCYGRVGQSKYLMSKASGTWAPLVIGDDTDDFVLHPRKPGEMPDIELTGPGFCFPVQRFHKGEYRLWKACDGNRQIFADAAPWIEDKSRVAPADSDATSVELASGEAAQLVDMRSLFDHNGSDVRIDPGAGTIIYEKPKSKIAGTVKPGTLLFKARGAWDPYDDNAVVRGTAYVFKKGCAPAPYEVAGRQDGWHTLVLKGAAPVREKGGCRIIGHRMNGNSTLKFVSWGD